MRVTDKLCPICKTVAETDVYLLEYLYTRWYGKTEDDANLRVGALRSYVKLYKCPCCRTVYDAQLDGDIETWKIQYEEIMNGEDEEENA